MGYDDRNQKAPRIGRDQDGNQSTHSVKIDQVENGFIIQVGCKTFIATTWAEASICLAEYFDNPAAAEKKYCRK